MNLISYRKTIIYTLTGILMLAGFLLYLYYFLFPSIKDLAGEIYDQKLNLEALKEQKKVQEDFSQEVYHRFPLVKDIEENLLNTENLVDFLEKIEALAKTNNLSQELQLKREEPPKKGKKSTDKQATQKTTKEKQGKAEQGKASQTTIVQAEKIPPYVDLSIALKGEFQDMMHYLEGFEKLESLPEVVYYEWQRQEDMDQDGNTIVSPELQLLIRVKLFCPPLNSKIK